MSFENYDNWKTETPPEGKEQLDFCDYERKLKRKSKLLTTVLFLENITAGTSGLRLIHLKNSMDIALNKLKRINKLI